MDAEELSQVIEAAKSESLVILSVIGQVLSCPNATLTFSRITLSNSDIHVVRVWASWLRRTKTYTGTSLLACMEEVAKDIK